MQIRYTASEKQVLNLTLLLQQTMQDRNRYLLQLKMEQIVFTVPKH